MSDRKAFFNAVCRGDAARVAEALEQDPALLAERDEGATPLHFAAIHNRTEVVDLLLSHGANLDAVDEEFHSSPIGWANEKGHTDMVAYLYAKGSQVDLCQASAFGMVERVRQLIWLDRHSINRSNGYGTPIHMASLWGHPEIVEILLDNGADPNLPNSAGDSALQVALNQLAGNCRFTPIVGEARRKEMAAGCGKIVEILRRHGAKERASST